MSLGGSLEIYEQLGQEIEQHGRRVTHGLALPYILKRTGTSSHFHTLMHVCKMDSGMILACGAPLIGSACVARSGGAWEGEGVGRSSWACHQAKRTFQVCPTSTAHCAFCSVCENASSATKGVCHASPSISNLQHVSQGPPAPPPNAACIFCHRMLYTPRSNSGSRGARSLLPPPACAPGAGSSPSDLEVARNGLGS
jgi:hypothetical protein